MDIENLGAATSWLLRDAPGWVIGDFESKIAILHPGTHFIGDDPAVPFLSGNSDDDPMSDEQLEHFTAIMLKHTSADTPVVAALYAGFVPSEDLDSTAAELGGSVVRGPRLSHFLVTGTFGELNPLTREQADGWKPVSYLWPLDRAWFLASASDVAFSVLAGDRSLTEAVLADEVMNAVPWPEA